MTYTHKEFDHIDKTQIMTTAGTCFLWGQEEKARIYRDVYIAIQEITVESLNELIALCDKLLSKV